MAELDRATARALVDAGYMPLKRYVEMFGDFYADDTPPVVPRIEDEHPGHHILEAPLRFWRQMTSTH